METVSIQGMSILVIEESLSLQGSQRKKQGFWLTNFHLHRALLIMQTLDSMPLNTVDTQTIVLRSLNHFVETESLYLYVRKGL